MSAQVKYAKLSLRVGLAYVFLFVAVYSTISPQTYIHYIPGLVRTLIKPEIFLYFLSAGEVFLSIWLLLGKYTFWAGLVSAAMIVSITAPNIGELNVLFRNVAIFYAALALSALSWEGK